MSDTTMGEASNSIQVPKQQKTQSLKPKSSHKKLSRLPDTHKIQKRPLLHPPVASPYSSSTTSPKTIYVSSTTPFIATIKRIRAYLSAIESRSASSSKQIHQNIACRPNAKNRTEELRGLMQDGKEGAFLRGVEQAVKKRGEGEEVVLKATGKAVERLMSVAIWLENEGEGEEFVVRVRTGSVGAVDDVVKKEGSGDGNEEEEEMPGRVRRTSCLEVGVRFKGS
ncbi:Rpp20 subunit of nuclear RNase MRP and P-domain-containing protein [Amylocarpus encephaloides]|uniref:Rpp20 subunit of nuclear RNase MRP and P-domain-containing protein n=1 Tax=Amylocarpus encephaloides TaxID=45428 RepID=A0A9P8C606_9HELO|nr:Rpp20 subunit of nuclear RNase MRP and P-domain-containing protein [Amylocarpus encephaloides]